MKTAALIITTDLPNASGVTALMSEAGGISAGQRMICAFQCAGISLVGLVVGPENKKAERQFAQNGVVFLRCSDSADFFHGVKQGLSFLRGKYERILLVPGDMPLFLPKTVEILLRSTASVAVPEHGKTMGYPVLLDRNAADVVLGEPDLESAKKALRDSSLRTETVRVEDPGVLVRGAEMAHRPQLIENHNSQLARPVTEVTLCNSGPLYDPRLSMLLHLVEHTRSVWDACSLMQISYSAAWNMLNHVEEELGFPLVTRVRGGSSDRGSVLTERGKTLMNAYDHFTEHLNKEARELYRIIFEPTSKLQ